MVTAHWHAAAKTCLVGDTPLLQGLDKVRRDHVTGGHKLFKLELGVRVGEHLVCRFVAHQGRLGGS